MLGLLAMCVTCQWKKVIYKYDCNFVPIHKNQLDVLHECGKLTVRYWLPKFSKTLFPTPSLKCTTVVDPSPTLNKSSSANSICFYVFEKHRLVDQHCSSQTSSDSLWRNFTGESLTTFFISIRTLKLEYTPTKGFL